jgi:hypothetical protein
MSDMDVARDDLALDALANGLVPAGDDPALALLGALRGDLDDAVRPPAKVVALRERPRRRSGALLALAAAAGIVVGGITAGAVVSSDQPGELLYAAHNAILGEEDRAAAADVTKLLDEAAGALANGDRTGARRLLRRAEAAIPAVPVAAERAALRERLDTLTAFAVDPTPSPTPSPSPSDDSDDDSSGKGSGSDDSDSRDDSSGSGSGGDDSDNSGSGKGGDDSDDGDNSGSGKSGSG